MIDLAILGLLREQDLHGYELRKRISDLPGLKTAVSFGALYPALARLEAAGAVGVVEGVVVGGAVGGVDGVVVGVVDGVTAGAGVDPDPTIPPTGSLAGEAAAYRARRRSERPPAAARPSTARSARAKKAYTITEVGERLLVELIDDPATDERAFPLKVAFCRYLTPVRRLELFERRRAILAGRLAGERTSRKKMGDRLDLYLGSLREHDHQTIQHDIAWLDELITSERALTVPAAGREEDTEE
jgi:DNA-binding PadR family transcriptional regulator